MSEVTPEMRKVLAQCYAYLLSLPNPSEDDYNCPRYSSYTTECSG